MDLEAQIWSQRDEQKQTVVRPQTHLQRLFAAYKVAEQMGECTENALQHTCSQDCEWKDIDEEWLLCTKSLNLHICTSTECQYRTGDDGAVTIKQHSQVFKKRAIADEEVNWTRESVSNSICTLTGRIREPIDLTTVDWFDRGGLHEQMNVERAPKPKDKLLTTNPKRQDDVLKLIDSFYGKSFTAQNRKFVSDICLKLWAAIHMYSRAVDKGSQLCKFVDFCLVVFKDLYTGLPIKITPSESVMVIPRGTMPMPSALALDGPSCHWHIIISKQVHTAILKIPADKLRDIAAELNKKS